MGAFKSFLQFTVGAGVGAACGYSAARLLAPQPGEDLQGSVDTWTTTVSQAGVDASQSARAGLENQYRNLVSDPEALTNNPPEAST